MKTEMKVPNECLYPTDVFLISCGMGCKRIIISEIAYNQHVGMVIADFPAKDLIERIISLNL